MLVCVTVICILFCVCIFSVFFMFFVLFSFVDSPSVLWYCWLGLLTCKNCLPYNLYCVGGDVKHCSLTDAVIFGRNYYTTTHPGPSCCNGSYQHVAARLPTAAQASTFTCNHYCVLLQMLQAMPTGSVLWRLLALHWMLDRLTLWLTDTTGQSRF